MRRLEFRSKDAIDLLNEPITSDQLKELTGVTRRNDQSYHLKYGPHDIRKARESLQPNLVDFLEGPYFALRGGRPPFVTSHISKGGTGKTTVIANLAVALVKQGYRVLLIDGDPQASLSTLMGVDVEKEDLLTLRSVLLEKQPVQKAIRSIYENATLDFIAADVTLTRFEREIMPMLGRERLFEKFVEANKNIFRRYEFVLIDTNPGSTVLNFNLMLVADLILAVVMLDGLSLKALTSLAADVAELSDHTKLPRHFMLVPNNYHPTFRHVRDNLPALAERYQALMSKAVIPSYTGFARQGKLDGESLPLLESEPTSSAAKVIIELSRELLQAYIHKPFERFSTKAPST